MSIGKQIGLHLIMNSHFMLKQIIGSTGVLCDSHGWEIVERNLFRCVFHVFTLELMIFYVISVEKSTW